jgi:hypothetical protein
LSQNSGKSYGQLWKVEPRNKDEFGEDGLKRWAKMNNSLKVMSWFLFWKGSKYIFFEALIKTLWIFVTDVSVVTARVGAEHEEMLPGPQGTYHALACSRAQSSRFSTMISAHPS